jgi:4-hydroxybenzoate polyprenyltransferase
MNTNKTLEERKEIVKTLMRFGKTVIFSYMIIGAIITVYMASQYHRFDALAIALFGTLGVVISGCVFAYYLGNELGKVYGKIVKVN